MARLRLQAGCCMLKLAQEPVYAEAIRLEQFETMALLVNVSTNCHCIWLLFSQNFSSLFPVWPMMLKFYDFQSPLPSCVILGRTCLSISLLPLVSMATRLPSPLFISGQAGTEGWGSWHGVMILRGSTLRDGERVKEEGRLSAEIQPTKIQTHHKWIN